MDIVVSANNNEEVLVFPTVPKGDIELSHPQNNEEVTTVNGGALNLIGNFELKTLSLSHIWPDNQYPWVKGEAATGSELIAFFLKWRQKRVPIRIVITDNNDEEDINLPVSIDNFNYSRTRSGDVRYTLDLKEFRFVKGA